MTFIDVRKGQEGRAAGEGTPGVDPKAGARVPARTRGQRVADALALVGDRAGSARRERPSAVLEDGSPDTVRGRSPWSEGAASPAAVLAYTSSGAWCPGEQDVWLERAGKAYGYLALAITVLVTYPLWIVQRPSRFALAVALLGLLWLTWGLS